MASDGWRRITNSFLPCFLPSPGYINIQFNYKISNSELDITERHIKPNKILVAKASTREAFQEAIS
jgi:hypothetical protein